MFLISETYRNYLYMTYQVSKFLFLNAFKKIVSAKYWNIIKIYLPKIHALLPGTPAIWDNIQYDILALLLESYAIKSYIHYDIHVLLQGTLTV